MTMTADTLVEKIDEATSAIATEDPDVTVTVDGERRQIIDVEITADRDAITLVLE